MEFEESIPSPLGYENWQDWGSAISGVLENMRGVAESPLFYSYTSAGVALETDTSWTNVQTLKLGQSRAPVLLGFSCALAGQPLGSAFNTQVRMQCSIGGALIAEKEIAIVYPGQTNWVGNVSLFGIDQGQPAERTKTVDMKVSVTSAVMQAHRRMLFAIEFRR